MSVRVKYNYKVDDGHEVVNFETWVNTLSENEQAEFKDAQHTHSRAIAIKTASGVLTVEYTPEMTYVWKSADDADAGLGENPVWERYHNRYLAENNIKLEITKE